MADLKERIEAVKNMHFKDTVITDAYLLADGTFKIDEETTVTDIPEVVVVKAEIRPSKTSYIRTEMWLPTKTWNKRFLGTGNGGSAGGINYWTLINNSKSGFAAINTDMGTSPDVDLGVGDPERWADFGHRSTHLMTLLGKETVKVFYGEEAEYSYFVGGSTGGEQALGEAQRYPEDYDGIVASVPANNRTLLHTYFIWNYQVTTRPDGSKVFSEDDVRSITKAAVEFLNENTPGECKADNFTNDPRGDIEVAKKIIKKVRTDNPSFTDEQADALLKLYEGPVNPRTGERIYTPVPFGSEISGPGVYAQQDKGMADGLLYVFRWVFGKDYDYRTFDFDKDMDTYNDALAPHVNANNPDLSAFKAHGGKLIMTSGSADPLVPYQDALSYYERVIELQGSVDETRSFIRYYIAPGMSHGPDGPGIMYLASMADCKREEVLDAVISWRETGKVPDCLYGVRDKGEGDDFARPVYAYPEKSEYDEKTGEWKRVMGKRGGVERLAERYLK